jgi:hypothetical protein
VKVLVQRHGLLRVVDVVKGVRVELSGKGREDELRLPKLYSFVLAFIPLSFSGFSGILAEMAQSPVEEEGVTLLRGLSADG